MCQEEECQEENCQQKEGQRVGTDQISMCQEEECQEENCQQKEGQRVVPLEVVLVPLEVVPHRMLGGGGGHGREI
jgi:hypothetical protein